MEEPAGDQATKQPDMDRALAEFEARIDKSDTEQLKILDTMREHTRRLHQKRGDWNQPNTRRNWNLPPPRDKATAPTAIESYREYKQHLAQEAAWQQLQHVQTAPMQALPAPAER